MNKIEIYTDGACKGNPGLGGWGAIILFGNHSKTIYGAQVDTTNNRMELLAAINALMHIKSDAPINIFTDSKYVQQGMNEWIKNWIKNNWRTSSKKPVQNADLWNQLNQLNQNHKIEWNWVKGHSEHLGNELADLLANTAIINFKNNH